ncbi:hypothetical protein EPD60_12380 [Flaviaesturariibacter flavus]|uniref:Outer membrane protein beta-barrel domain-containing protein n=1 Tax=Flaviaesturariibacter flavus TaxID=2502780 RepID=A0A4R1B9L1_9BACT|nr:DUF6089 family protein [Flaviaesturariibacter flavus]TCJ13588.1 hypothetical protein EPD60_12380 [Flaviaesturariibacter flavus]
MKHRPMLRPYLLAAAIALAARTSAQSTETPNEVGAGLGAMIYQGDLTPSPAGSYRTARPAVALWAARQLTSRLALRATLQHGSVYGDDARYTVPAWRSERALRFSTSVSEISLQAVYRPDNRWLLQPYLFAGVGYAFVKVNRDASAFNTAFFNGDKRVMDGLATDLATAPPRAVPVVPLGAGLRYNLTEALSLHLETSYRLARTDYLDGFSAVGNPKRLDHYQSYILGASWRFGSPGGGRGKSKGIGCPRW